MSVVRYVPGRWKVAAAAVASLVGWLLTATFFVRAVSLFPVAGWGEIALLAGLDLEGICGSSGSACSAGSLEPSHVVVALGFDKKLASALVRFSLGRETTEEEVALAEKIVPRVVERAQRYQQDRGRV